VGFSHAKISEFSSNTSPKHNNQIELEERLNYLNQLVNVMNHLKSI
jgi:hypothetical protein